MSVRINIECAEQIIDSNKTKRKQWLKQLINQVQTRRHSIQLYLSTVIVIEKHFKEKQEYLQRCIDQLIDREQSLEQDLSALTTRQIDLKKRQGEIERCLSAVRQESERHREKKLKCEQRYAQLSFMPILAGQSKKKYLKARNKDWQTEQQLSEMRGALDICRDHLRIVSRQASQGQSEQDAISNQRRASAETIKGTLEQLTYLKQGSEFWSGFDAYQAQVVLEAAQYLLKNNRYKTSKKITLDVDQVWVKTFKLACLEYGDRQEYGDRYWNINTLKINFDCSICRASLVDWPKVSDRQELVCEACFKPVEKQATIIPIPSNTLKKIFTSLNFLKINILV